MNKIYCCESGAFPRDTDGKVPHYVYPEFGLMPDKQIEKTKEIVEKHARSGEPYVLVTVSPYVLKSAETYSDLLEQGESVEYYNSRLEKTDFQSLFKDMAIPFTELMRGERAFRTHFVKLI